MPMRKAARVTLRSDNSASSATRRFRSIAPRCTPCMKLMYDIHWTHDGERRKFFVATWGRATRRRLAMFVVLGASGNTGKVVAEKLLQQKKEVRVVLHDAAKGNA